MKRLDPPSGAEPPHSADRSDGTRVDLGPLAREVCKRYFEEFPDHVERYGTAGEAWCVHDSLYLFAWAIAEHDWSDVELQSQVDWLANVLAARDFPLGRLARHLELAAALASERGDGGVARLLRDAASSVRARGG